MKDFSNIVHHLCKVLEKVVKLILDDLCLKAIKCLSYELTSSAKIMSPDWSVPFKVMCDGNGVELGAFLS